MAGTGANGTTASPRRIDDQEAKAANTASSIIAKASIQGSMDGESTAFERLAAGAFLIVPAVAVGKLDGCFWESVSVSGNPVCSGFEMVVSCDGDA